MNKDSMIFYQEWRNAVAELEPVQRCLVYEAVFDYAFAGIEPSDAIIKAITSIMRNRIDKDNESYQAVCERNRENVKKRWEKAKTKNNQEIPKDTTVYERIPPYTTEYDSIPNVTKNTDTDTDTDNDFLKSPNGDYAMSTFVDAAATIEGQKGENPKAETIDYDSLKKFFNDTLVAENSAIPKVSNIRGERRAKVNARIREYGKEAVVTAIKKAAVSDFLNGRADKHFLANFDWMFAPRNFPKVLEGNYDNQPSRAIISTNQPTNSYGSTARNLTTADDRREELAEHVANKLAAGEQPERDLSAYY